MQPPKSKPPEIKLIARPPVPIGKPPCPVLVWVKKQRAPLSYLDIDGDIRIAEINPCCIGQQCRADIAGDLHRTKIVSVASLGTHSKAFACQLRCDKNLVPVLR